ncbi:NAD(P)-binding protein [Xylogone sp. PMI_703]|nr:NAD(P)-binding protein [Xylogone sp. PMI_703]
MVIAIVTGASRGIGRAIALQLAEDGMDVAINDIPNQTAGLEAVKAEIQKRGRKSGCFYADVSDEAQVQRMIGDIVSQFGELNVMVANAGIIVAKTLLEVSVEEWDRVQAINVRGVMICYREAAKQMIKQGKGGKIIGACSTAGFRSTGNTVAYATSKWAVRGLTQQAAAEFAPYDINVNAYAPGPVPTHMWEEIDASLVKRRGLQPGEAIQKSVETRSVLKRTQAPEDIANLVSFLASPKARNITGQSVLCDGGINFS